jgi:hypothetical protein
MDERFNRRLLLLIAGLVLVVLTLAVLTLRQFVKGIDEQLVPWPMWLAVSFNVVVLIATAVITVGHFDRRLVGRFFALVVACKAVATLLTAAGFLLTTPRQALASVWPAVSGALLAAGLGSWSASVLHAIGALVVARVLRTMVMGRQLALEGPPEGIILPTLREPEMVAGEPTRADELWLAPPEPGVDPFTSPATAEREQAEGEEELDRVVAAAAPVTADLEAMPDQPVPEPEAAPEPEKAVAFAEAAADEEAASEAEVVSEAEAVPEAEVTSEAGVVPDEEFVADLEAEAEAAAEEEGALESVTELAPEPWEPEAVAHEEPEAPVEPETGVPEPASVEPALVEPAAEHAEAPRGGANEIVLTIGEILGCFADEDIALSQSEVREERGGDDLVRLPLDVVLPQIENGVVQVEAGLIFDQLPRAAFSRSPEEISGSLWQGKVELPLARVVDQVPRDAMRRSYEAEQPSGDEFPEPFKDTLAGAPRRPSEPVVQKAAAAAPALLEPVAEPETEIELAPMKEPGPPSEEIAAAAPEQEEVEEAERPEEIVPAAPAAEERAPARPAPRPVIGAPPGMLNVSAEYVVAQFPESAMAMPIEDIEAKLDPHGRLRVPIDEVLPQLAEGYVAVDVGPLLEQLPPGAVGVSWGELADTLPEHKVQLPLDEVVAQIPPAMLVPGVEQTEQASTEEIPDPFAEGRARPVAAAAPAAQQPPVEPVVEPPVEQAPEPVVEEAVEPVPELAVEPVPELAAEPVPELAAEPPTPPEEAEPVPEPEPEPAAATEEAAERPEDQLEEVPLAAAETIEIPWAELLPQFPADAFRVSREQLNNALEGKAARIDVDLVRPQLGEGQVTVPCGYVLAQFPDEYLELSVEQLADRMPEARFELPLVSVVQQLPKEALALPAEQALQESTDEIPTVFAEPGAEQPAQEPAAQPVEAAEAAGPSESPAEPEPQPEPEPVAEAAEAEWAAEPPEEVPAEPALAEEAPEPWAGAAEPQPELAEPMAELGEPSLEGAAPLAEPGDMEGLTESDITQLESLLADKRREETGFEDEGEFVDDLFVSDEAAAEVTMPVVEPEPPSAVEEPAVEPVEAERVAEPPFELDEYEPRLGPVEEPATEPSTEEFEIAEAPEPEVEEPEPAIEEFAAEEAAPEEAAAETAPAEPVAAERVEPARPERVEPAPWAGPPAAAGVAAALHEKKTFRDLLHTYSKYHVEHGIASLETGRLVFSFTPAETSAETLARELAPRFDTLARLAGTLGCEPMERAVLMAEKGAIVCEWLPDETGAGLVLMATTDRRAAGMMHLQVRHDTGSLSRLSGELRAESGAPVGGRPPRREPEGCEVAWPEGRPYDQIGDLLGGYDITTVALLRFASGSRWMLASSALPTLSAEAPSTSGEQACYNPDELFELPEELRLGRAQSVLAMAGRHVVTVNAPAPGGELGLICVFPGQFREGLLKMKADKASALLCGV